jgi:hypothetical protein
MSLATSLPAVILATILARLARLFLTGAGGDLNAARNAASQMLAAYHPETEDELSLAAEVISFAFHALDALSQAADPDMSLNQKLRPRGSAVSLSREFHKSQRKLDQLQKGRRAGIMTRATETPVPKPEPAPPTIDKALQLIEITREAPPTAGTSSTSGTPGGGGSDAMSATSGLASTGGGRSMVQTGRPMRLAAMAISRADSPKPEARVNSPAMAMPGAVPPDRGDGLGASHPVACAKACRRRTAGRPRHNACGAV